MEQKPISNNSSSKIKVIIKELNIVAVCLLVCQFFKYIKHGDVLTKQFNNNDSYFIFCLIGFNIYLLIALFLFFRATFLGNKLKHIEKDETTSSL